MDRVLDFIIINYIWLLGGAILILLAIIGYYADKTNFGQGQKKEIEKEPQKDLIKDMALSEAIEKSIKADVEEEKPIEVLSDKLDLENNPKPRESEDIIEKETFNSEFDKEFDSVLPKKRIIEGELLDDINSLSLTEESNIGLNDIPDLDNVELPTIKQFNKDEDDIWKK